MPEVVGDFLVPRQGAEIGGDEPPQREEIKITAPGKKDDQQNGEQKRRDGIADNDERAAPDIEPAAVVHRFADPKRYRDQIDDQRTPQPERDRNRQALLDQRQH